jgi:hypothetical protein
VVVLDRQGSRMRHLPIGGRSRCASCSPISSSCGRSLAPTCARFSAHALSVTSKELTKLAADDDGPKAFARDITDNVTVSTC